MLDHAERVIALVVAESGKTYEDAQLADLGYTVSALGFWATQGGRLPGRRARAVVEQPPGGGQEAAHPLRAGRGGRRHRPVELPDRQLVRRLHPRAGRRQQLLVGGHPRPGPGRFYEPTVLVDVTRRALKREPFMFPYRARRTRLLGGLFRLLYGRGRRDWVFLGPRFARRPAG